MRGIEMQGMMRRFFREFGIKLKRPSVKTQLERTKGIIDHEMIWSKKIGRKLKPTKFEGISTKERMVQTERQYDKSLKNFPKSDFVVHQHPPVGNEPGGRAIVGVGDLIFFSDLIGRGKTKTGVVACFNREGNDAGHIFYKINKMLTRETGAEIRKLLGKVNEETVVDYNERFTKYLKQHRIEIKRRFVPMPGYKLGNKGYFVKVEKQRA